MYRIVMSVLLLAGEAAAHPGHDAAAVHLHGWDYAWLAALIAVGLVGWYRARK